MQMQMQFQTTDTKVCTKCSESKQLSEFNKKKASKDGLQYTCKECTSIQNRAYTASNSVKVAAYNKAWQEANPDKMAAYKKAWRGANPAYNKAWREANPDRIAALSGKGDVIQRGGSASDIYDLELCIPFYAEARRLSRETGVLHHVDHITPIAKGGLHCQTNLQVLTALENIQKGDSL